MVRAALSKSPADRPSADQILLRLLGQPETVGASTAVLNQGAQVAGDDTTPFSRVSPTLADRARRESAAGMGSLPQQTGDVTPYQHLGGPTGDQRLGGQTGASAGGSGKCVDQRLGGQTGDVASYQHSGGPGGHQQAGGGPYPQVSPAPVRRRGRGKWWAVLVAVLALAAAATLVVLGDSWQLFGAAGSGATEEQPPSAGSSVADKVAGTGKILIGVKGDLPGVGLSRGGRFEGFDVDLARRIAEELGAKRTDFVAVSRADRAGALAEGKVDLVVATYSVNDDDVEFAGPYYLAHQDLLVRPGSIDSIEDLEGKKICGVNSPSVGIVQDRVKVEPVPAGNYAECMDLLRSGAVDAVPGDDLILAGFAGRENQRYKVLGAKLNDERYAVALRTGDVKTCKAINGVIADLYRTGFIKQLMKKHFAKVDFTPESKVPAMNACE